MLFLCRFFGGRLLSACDTLSVRRWLKAFTFLAMSGASVVHAADPLLTPSVPSAMVESSALLSVNGLGERLIAVGERGHILLSNDSGLHWNQASAPVSVTLTDSAFANENIGWALGHDGVVLKTEDAGETWQLKLDGFELNRLIHAQMQSMQSLLKEKLELTTDSEQVADLQYQLTEIAYAVDDIEDALANRSTRPLFDLEIVDPNTVLVVGAYGTLFKTIDGGESWQLLMDRMKNPEGLHLYDLHTLNGAIYLAGEYGLLSVSRDSGETWTMLTSPYQGSFFGVNGDSEQVIAFGLQGNVFKSEDAGQSWDSIQLSTSSAIIDMNYLDDGRMVFLATDGNLFLTNAQGNSVQRIETEVEGATALFRAGQVIWLSGLNGLHPLENIGTKAL